MAKKWTAEETALILREVQNPTVTNQELAEQLGRSLQSIAAKKRYAEEQLKQQSKAQPKEQPKEQPAPSDPNRPWTAQEDEALLETPLKSENDLAAELNRPKDEVHKRRDYLVKSRLAERERKASAQKAEAEKSKRVPLEACTTVLKTEPEPPQQESAVIRRLQKQLDAARAAVSILKHKNFNTVREFTVIMDYILGEDESGAYADENTDN